MVIMEAMARGCIILATPVGDIPALISHTKHGFLFSSIAEEEIIIKEAIDYLKRLLSDRALCNIISNNNIVYAREHFGLTTFEEAYRNLFDSEKN
jgi:glycosyltransferase involved in cell wall biosynthesis